jgi:hypothetical protein
MSNTADRMLGLVRAYAPPLGMKRISRRKRRKAKPWVPQALLVFDLETSTDERQALIFGFWRYFRLRVVGGHVYLTCVEEGIVYADELPDTDPAGFVLLQEYGLLQRAETDTLTLDASGSLRLLSRAEFVCQVLVPALGNPNAAVCGFNLAYDLSRLALVAERTNRRRRNQPDMFEGGFSLGLESYRDAKGVLRTDSPLFGRLRIRSLDSKKHVFEWTRKNVRHNGHLLDARMLAFGLSGEAGSLEACCERFGIIDPRRLEAALTGSGVATRELYPNLGIGCARELASLLLSKGAKAIVGGDHDLAALLSECKKPFEKRPVSHGRIAPEYIEYARDDVWATGELVRTLLEECHALGLTVQATRVFSPASIAKDLYDRLGVRPLLERYPKLDPEALGLGMVAFYGGRAEAHIRKILLPCSVVDATSMYPAAAVNLGLHRFDSRRLKLGRLKSDEVAELQAVLDGLSPEQLLDPGLHPELVFVAQVEPQAGDILPVRAPYSGEGEHGIGVNDLEHAIEPLWYAGPDVAASTILAGKAPHIRQALVFEFGRRLAGLRSLTLPDGTVLDPGIADPNQRLIEARKRLERRSDLSDSQRRRCDRFLKVVANSLYGVSAEMNRQEDEQLLEVYGLRHFETKKPAEVPGDFFNPFRASLTTAWARLMLALLERLVADAGGSYLAMDTDSMLVVSSQDGGLHACTGGCSRLPDGREAIKALSWRELEAVLRRFDPLRAFDTQLIPDFWKLEKTNFEGNDPTQRRRQLWCLAISAKRYALFAGEPERLRPIAVAQDTEEAEDAAATPLALDGEATVELVDRREHGLGHLLNPLGPSSDSRDWIGKAWTYLEQKARGLSPAEPEWFRLPAMSRITLSTPDLRRPFVGLNTGKPYGEQVKPFNFLMRPRVDQRYLPAGHEVPSLIAPYNENPDTWLTASYLNLGTEQSGVWHITTGRPDPVEPHTVTVKTYGEVIADYWRHPEPKSLGPDGKPCRADTVGLLHRRRVRIVQLQHLGKEGNKLEQREQGLVSGLADYENRYDDPACDTWSLYVAKALPAFTTTQIAEATRRGPGPVLAPTIAETLDQFGRALWKSNDPLPERTIRDARRRRPSRDTTRLITAALVRLAAELLDRDGIPVPRTAPGSPYVDELACLSRFTDEDTLCIRICSLGGCDNPARPRSPYCSEAHKKQARRNRAA